MASSSRMVWTLRHLRSLLRLLLRSPQRTRCSPDAALCSRSVAWISVDDVQLQSMRLCLPTELLRFLKYSYICRRMKSVAACQCLSANSKEASAMHGMSCLTPAAADHDMCSAHRSL